MGKSTEDSAELQAYKTAEKTYNDAKSAYDARVSKASSEVSKARKTKNKDIKAIEKDRKLFLEEFEKPIGKFVQPKSTVTLYRTHIESDKFRLDLETGMKVEVSTSGNTSATLIGTRDSRQLFINILTSQGNMTISCNPDNELEARSFAGQISVAAASVVQTTEQYKSTIDSFDSRLQAEQQDSSLIDAAEVSLASTRNDTSSIDQAKVLMEEAGKLVTDDEMNGHLKRKKRNTIIKWGAIAVIVVIAIVCWFMFQ
ncbi:hypothetical protein BPY_21000 [Bifidobacterium psychraerophilum]|uniref:hypothetical protein n=1 Tax=Bifidobacterium psychraerophilum TaxID=218140 RepID=UPI00311561D5